MKVSFLTTSLGYCALATLLATAGCNNAKVDGQAAAQANKQPTGGACETAKAVRTVADAKGFITYDKATNQYSVLAPVPGTTDEVNVGVVCGQLPADLRTAGRKVVFSGTYKEYANAPAAPGGYSTYYLSVSKISAQ